MPDRSIINKRVLIAGGAKNLGALLAVDLAYHGAKAVTIHYHSDETKLQADRTLGLVEAAGADAFVFQANLTDGRAVEELFQYAKAEMGGIDVAVNTVGKIAKKAVVETTEAEFDDISAVNSKSAFMFIKSAARHLENNGKICSVLTSLIGAYTASYAAYAGAKAAVEHFTRAASKELGSRGISVTAIGPGPMDTPFFYAAESEDAVAVHKSSTALADASRTGLTDIEDVVPWIRFLVTEGWWLNGQTILVNGGYTAK